MVLVPFELEAVGPGDVECELFFGKTFYLFVETIPETDRFGIRELKVDFRRFADVLGSESNRQGHPALRLLDIKAAERMDDVQPIIISATSALDQTEGVEARFWPAGLKVIKEVAQSLPARRKEGTSILLLSFFPVAAAHFIKKALIGANECRVDRKWHAKDFRFYRAPASPMRIEII